MSGLTQKEKSRLWEEIRHNLYILAANAHHGSENSVPAAIDQWIELSYEYGHDVTTTPPNEFQSNYANSYKKTK